MGAPHFVWQGAIVAAALAVLLRVTRGSLATTRYALAIAALSVMAVLPVATALQLRGTTATRVPGIAPVIQEEAIAAAVLEGDAKSSPPVEAPRFDVGAVATTGRDDAGGSHGVAAGLAQRTRDLRVQLMALVHRALPGLVVLWLCGVLVLSLRLLGGWMQAQRFRRIGTRPAPERVAAAAARIAGVLGVRRAVRVLESTWLGIPAVVGWLRPVLLVPVTAITALEPRQLEMLLAHELAHVRRHDYFVNLLQSWVETLLFYHPAAWWVSRQIRIEREHCCDDLAVAVCGDARLYARTLADLERLRFEPALAVAATGGVLSGRVRRLLAPPRSHADTPARWAIGTVGLVTALGVLGGLLVSPRTVPPTRAAPSGVSRTAERVAPKATHPQPGARLADRWNWGLEQARASHADGFWIGYAIGPNPDLRGLVFTGHIGEDEQPLRGNGIGISGHFIHIGDPGDTEWRFPGTPLAVEAAPGAVALLFQFDGSRGSTLSHAHAASLMYAVNLKDQPLFWLGAANDAESLALVRTLDDKARGLDARVDLVDATGVHASTAEVVPLLLRKFQSREVGDVRSEAADWLGRHPHPDALVALARAARDDRSGDVRREAAESAGEMRLEAATDTTIALARTLDDPDARREAVEALGDKSDERSLQALIEIARRDDDASIAREATETLGSRREPRAHEALVELARSSRSDQVRQEAVETLGESMPADKARALLREIATSNPSEQAQREAIETLAQLPGGEGMDDVRKLARTHPDVDMRRQAVEELGQVDDATAVAELEKIADQDASVDVQREAVETLGQRPERRAREALKRFAREHPSVDVRREAVETLGEALEPKEAVRVLAGILNDTRETDVAREALETLGELPDGLGIPEIIKAARSHPDPELRREALRALVDSDDPRARSFLDRAMDER